MYILVDEIDNVCTYEVQIYIYRGIQNACGVPAAGQQREYFAVGFFEALV